jgi:hypothetical protein
VTDVRKLSALTPRMRMRSCRSAGAGRRSGRAGGDRPEQVQTQDGLWLGAVVEAMNDQERKGVRLRNVRTWLAS